MRILTFFYVQRLFFMVVRARAFANNHLPMRRKHGTTCSLVKKEEGSQVDTRWKIFVKGQVSNFMLGKVLFWTRENAEPTNNNPSRHPNP